MDQFDKFVKNEFDDLQYYYEMMCSMTPEDKENHPSFIMFCMSEYIVRTDTILEQMGKFIEQNGLAESFNKLYKSEMNKMNKETDRRNEIYSLDILLKSAGITRDNGNIDVS